MAKPHRIGLYLSNHNIIIVESDSKKIQKITSSPITSSVSGSSQDIPFHSDTTEEIHIVGILQKLLRESKIEGGNIAVSIPIEEIFLRSFVIPWMPASELNNVVFFEAKKYVPFDLKLLEYVYEAVTFTENKQKRLRIIFYAIRKQTLEKYDRIFKQINFKPVSYEPALVSLAKQLAVSKHLHAEQKTVVIYVSENYGQIVFYEKGIAHFVREFNLSITEMVQDPRAIPDVIRAQLLREVRKSFGYYNRQFSQEKIKDVFVLANEQDEELLKNLSEEFSVRVKTITPSLSAGSQQVSGIEAFCAVGASVSRAPGVVSFNFLESKSGAASVSSSTGGLANFLPSSFLEFFTWDKSDFIYAIRALVICSVFLIAGFFYGQFSLSSVQKQSNELIKQEAEYDQKSLEDIEAEITNNKNQLDTYIKILNDHSHMAPLIIHLTQNIKEGMWLESASFQNTQDHLTMGLQGYVVTPSEGSEFKMINDLIVKLKSDKYFSGMKLKSNNIQKKNIENREVSFFSITGT